MSTPPNSLRDFVTQLQNDSDLCGEFTADPVGTMTAAGLSAEDQAILQTRNLETIGAAIGNPSQGPICSIQHNGM